MARVLSGSLARNNRRRALLALFEKWLFTAMQRSKRNRVILPVNLAEQVWGKSWKRRNPSHPRSEWESFCLQSSWDLSFFSFSKPWCSTKSATHTAPLEAIPTDALGHLFFCEHLPDKEIPVLRLAIRSTSQESPLRPPPIQFPFAQTARRRRRRPSCRRSEPWILS